MKENFSFKFFLKIFAVVLVFQLWFVNLSFAIHHQISFRALGAQTLQGGALSQINPGTDFRVPLLIDPPQSLTEVYVIRLRLTFEENNALGSTITDIVKLEGFEVNTSLPGLTLSPSSVIVATSDGGKYINFEWYSPSPFQSINGETILGYIKFRANNPGYIDIKVNPTDSFADSYVSSQIHRFTISNTASSPIGQYTVSAASLASPSPSPSPAATYTITGKVFKDLNGNSFQQDDEVDWTDITTNGAVSIVLDGNMANKTDITSTNSTYTFSNLAAGSTHTVRLIPKNSSSNLPESYDLTTNLNGTTGASAINSNISITSSNNVTLNLGLKPRTASTAPSAAPVSCTAVSVAGLTADPNQQTTDGGPVYKINPTAFTASNSLNRQLTATLSPGTNLNIPSPPLTSGSKIDLADSALSSGTDAITVTTTNGEIWLNIPKKTTPGSTDNRYEFTPRASIGTSHASCKTINILVPPVLASPSPSPVPVYNISGKVFKDVNNNGLQDLICATPQPSAGSCDSDWTNDGSIDILLLNKDTGQIATRDSVGAGKATYTFNNLTAGNYQVMLSSTALTLSNYSIKPVAVKDITIPSTNTVANFGLKPLEVLECPADIVSTQVRFKNDRPSANEVWVTSKTVRLGQTVRVAGFHNNLAVPASGMDLIVTDPNTIRTTLAFQPDSNEVLFTPTLVGTHQIKAIKRAKSGEACQGISTLTVGSATTTGYILSEDKAKLEALITLFETNPQGAINDRSWVTFGSSPVRTSLTLQNPTIGQRKTVYVIFKNSNSQISRIFESSITYIGASPTISNVKCTYADGKGTIVTIAGANFGQKGSASLVTVGTKAAAIDEWTGGTTVFSSPSASPAPSASPGPAGSFEDKIVARVNERLTTQTPVVVKVNDGRTVTSGCAVDLTSVSFIGRTQCRPPGNFAADNVNVIIVEVASTPSNEQCDGAKRPEGCACSANNQCVSNKCESSVCVVKHEPIFNQKIKLDQAGKPQGFAPNIEKNKTYALIVKAPKTVSKKQEFLAEEGTSNFEMSLSVGDIAPIDLPDGKINSLDRSRLVSEWVLTRDVTGRLADFNGDSRVNSVDWSCMRMNFNKSDETVGDIKPVAPASSLSSPTPSVSPSPSPRGSASPNPSPSPSPAVSPSVAPSPSPSPVSDAGGWQKLKNHLS